MVTEGRSKMVIWRIVIGTLVAALLAVGSWGMTRVATMTERHPTRIEFRDHCQGSDRKFDKIQETLDLQQRRVEDKLDKIQEYLMGKPN